MKYNSENLEVDLFYRPTPEDIKTFWDEGFLIVPNLFSPAELEKIKISIEQVNSKLLSCRPCQCIQKSAAVILDNQLSPELSQ